MVRPRRPSRLDELERVAPTAELDPLRGDPAVPRTPAGLLATARRAVPGLLPGLALVATLVGAAFAVEVATGASPLVAAVALGALVANLGVIPATAEAGVRFAAKRLLRAGIVLLGLQLAVDEVLDLGLAPLAVVAVTVAATFVGTRWLGRRLGVSDGLSTLTATGFSICGASAVAAAEGVTAADEEDVAVAIGLVTLFGSLAIVALPLLRAPLGLEDPAAFGAWVGASVHDVGQVVAASSPAGAVAVQTAVVVKLSRVVLLAPLVVGLGMGRRHAVRSGADPVGGAVADAEGGPPRRRPPLLPLFVVGFLAAVALRSTVDLDPGVLDAAHTAQQVLLAAALVGLGTGVRAARLRRVGLRPLALGVTSWALVASVAFVGVALTR